MKTAYLFLAGLSLLVAGCSQEDETPESCMGSCTTVAGRLVTAGGKEPLSQAEVEVQWRYGRGLQVNSRPKARTTTDNSGNYRLNFFIKDEEMENGYFLVRYTVNTDKYYVLGDDGQVLSKARRDTTFQLRTYLIPRKAYLNLAITNPTDVPRSEFLTGFSTCYGINTTFSRQIVGGGPGVFWGTSMPTNPLPVAGDQPILVRHSKTKNGVTTRTTDSLFIPAGTTYPYTVTY